MGSTTSKDWVTTNSKKAGENVIAWSSLFSGLPTPFSSCWAAYGRNAIVASHLDLSVRRSPEAMLPYRSVIEVKSRPSHALVYG